MKTIKTSEYRRLISSLVAARRSAGVSQAKVAETLGCSQSDISKIENCERRLDVLEFLYFLRALDHSRPVDHLSGVLGALVRGEH
jgi:transcriptional regulator with XRE-family HTH domain